MVLVVPMFFSNNNLTDASCSLLNITGKRFQPNATKSIWSYNPDECLKLSRKNQSASAKNRIRNSKSFITGSSVDTINQLFEDYQLTKRSQNNNNNNNSSSSNNNNTTNFTSKSLQFSTASFGSLQNPLTKSDDNIALTNDTTNTNNNNNNNFNNELTSSSTSLITAIIAPKSEFNINNTTYQQQQLLKEQQLQQQFQQQQQRLISSSSSSSANYKLNKKYQTNYNFQNLQTKRLSSGNVISSKQLRAQQVQFERDMNENYKQLLNINTVNNNINGNNVTKKYLLQTSSSFEQATIANEQYNLSRKPPKANARKMIEQFNQNEKQVRYGQHYDSLTSEILAALSDGVNENLKNNSLEKMSSSNSDDDAVYTNYTINETDPDGEDNFVLKVCNEIRSCKLSNRTNESRGDNDAKFDQLSYKSSKSLKQKSVKIIEPFEENQMDDENESNQVNLDELLLKIATSKDYPQSYFDAKINEEEQTQYYDNVLTEQFDQILQLYDGTLPVEVALKQSLPNQEYFASLTASTPNPSTKRDKDQEKEAPPPVPPRQEIVIMSKKRRAQKEKEKEQQEKQKKKMIEESSIHVNKDYEMYNILKRIMVKKKYEIATIKHERAQSSDKKKRRSTSSLSMVPSVSNMSSTNNLQALLNNSRPPSRPQTSLSTFSKPFPPDDDEEFETVDIDEFYNINNPTYSRCADCLKKIRKENKDADNNNNNQNANEFYYDEYKISSEAINKIQWPYELDSNLNDNNNSNTNTNTYMTANGNNNNNTSVTNNVNHVTKTLVMSNNKQITKNEKNNSCVKCYTCSNFIFTSKFVSKSENSFNYNANTNNNKQQDERMSSANETVTNSSSRKTTATSKKQNNDSKNEQKRAENSTFNSNRRSISAKTMKNVNEICLHNRKMTPAELLAYQRKCALLPGKSFNSQRRDSISISRVPISKIKADYDKEATYTYIYPLVKFQDQQNDEASTSATTTATTTTTPSTTSNPKVPVKAMRLRVHKSLNGSAETYMPVLNTKLLNDHIQMQAQSTDTQVTALQVYKKASRLIRKRPKTAK